MIRCTMGMRKPRVLPVPVFACAMLDINQRGDLWKALQKKILHIDSAQCLVDCPNLHICHGGEAHLVDNGVNDVVVNEALLLQILELGDGF